MYHYSIRPYRPFVNVKFEVDPEGELRSDEYHDDVRKRLVGGLEEFSTTVHVSKEIPADC